MRGSIYIYKNEKNIWKRDHSMLVNLSSIFFLYLRVLFLVNGFFKNGVSICGRLEDRITIQQTEVSEDGISRNVDQLSDVHVGKHHRTVSNYAREGCEY